MKDVSKSMSGSLSQKTLTSLLITIVPAVVNLIAYFWFVEENKYPVEIVTPIATVIGAFLTFIASCYLPRIFVWFPKARLYAKYEGKWLQIIPDFDRPFSIIDFTYNKEIHEYEMHGINYTPDLKQHVAFDAYRFIERTFRDGFYYITNPTLQNTNGLGKVCFIKNNEDNLIRAEGYFFDSGSAEFSRQYKTYLIKCDKRFFNLIERGGAYRNIKKISAMQIMKDCKDLAEEELEKHKI